MKKGFDSKLTYIKQYRKAKTKSYEGNISANFHGYKVPKEGSQCIWLSLLLINSIFITVKN